MNIFVLDEDIDKSASYHIDKHIVKMPLETAQLLCTACNTTGLKTPYKSTHLNHPCCIWARSSLANWLWLKNFGTALCKEYEFRYGKIHKCLGVIESLPVPITLPRQKFVFNKMPQCMPDEFKVANNIVAAYRKYYIGAKMKIAKWTKREVPEWINI